MDKIIERAWRLLRDRLETRSRMLGHEVRTYPTPIARCDDQLPKAIALRDAASHALRRAGELEVDRARDAGEGWIGRARDFAEGLDPGDDEALAKARDGLLETIAHSAAAQ
jgi:hypothetical protein